MSDKHEGGITIEPNGKPHKARYRIKKGMITLSYGCNIKTTQLGLLPPETLAHTLLAEMLTKSAS
ncbi:MAG: hypothetical protein HY272_10180 [Gammaproteobacteria bacterium]|nr:hypothetical protein [Gammaproteobacteria bacterium]